MATHPSILAWRIPWTEEHGGLQSIGSQRVRHDSAIKHNTAQQSISKATHLSYMKGNNPTLRAFNERGKGFGATL